MSNRTPHRDYQRTYSTLLKLPMDRTISDGVAEMLRSPTMRQQTLDEMIRIASGETTLTFITVANCKHCPAVFIHYPHEADKVTEWQAIHNVARHTVTHADEFRS